MTRRVAATVALSLALSFAARPLPGSALLSSWDFSVAGLGSFSQTGSLARFDASLGRLQKVYLGLDARGSFSVQFNQSASSEPLSQLYRATATLHSHPLGMAGENDLRMFVSSPPAPQRGGLATSARITSHAQFTPVEWEASVAGLPHGDTIVFALTGSLVASVAGGVTYDTDLAGQPLANGIAGRMYVKYIYEPTRAGDVNGDGRVDLSDFALVKGAFGATGEAAEAADLNGDLIVDLADFGQLKVGVYRQLQLDAAAVPEPASWALAAAGLLALGVIGRFRRR